MKSMPFCQWTAALVWLLGMTVSSFADETAIPFADEFTVKPDLIQKNVRQSVSDKKGGDAAQKKCHRCFKCGGSGHVTVSAREICDRCDGSGTVTFEVELKDTEHTFDGWWGPRTKKTTRKAYSKQPCPRCDRRGKISVKTEVECSLCKGKGEL